ncbi:extracellular solute-binding protein, partial [Dietzia sp. SLG310A2-38A2]|uniref:extracellular solute-binding protein n=1 Tax=Dietzia sp. SLG310A2-38A2 TaxID=1630643 RepID=UPI0019D6913B
PAAADGADGLGPTAPQDQTTKDQTMTLSRTLRALAATAAAGLALSACGNADTAGEETQSTAAGDSGTVITYNSPSEWGNFGEVLAAFSDETGISAPNDPKNSGQTLAALQAEAASPVADSAYVGIAFADQLVQADLLSAYTPEGVESIDEDLRDPDGRWHTLHTGAVAFIVNTEHLGDAEVPRSWEDLTKPEYRGKVGYLDPTQAAVGYSVATAANEAMGGDLDNWEPGLDYLGRLKDNGAVTPAQTATALVGQGEIPILIDTDFNGYKLQEEGIDVEVVIPEEGSLLIPYVVGIVNGAPNRDNAEELLDFYFSEQGQQLFARGFMRPAIGSIPDDMAAKMLPDTDYERARTVDYVKQGEVQEDFIAAFTTEVGR